MITARFKKRLRSVPKWGAGCSVDCKAIDQNVRFGERNVKIRVDPLLRIKKDIYIMV